MDNVFRELLEGLKQSAEGLVAAHAGMVQANEAIARSIGAALAANEEHEDLRETVRRLEGLVMDLVNRLPPK